MKLIYRKFSSFFPCSIPLLYSSSIETRYIEMGNVGGKSEIHNKEHIILLLLDVCFTTCIR